jgi:hypothetical protein
MFTIATSAHHPVFLPTNTTALSVEAKEIYKSAAHLKDRSTPMIATYIDEFIMFCAGLWMTCVGFGYLSLSRNPAHKLAVVRHFRWMGPLLLVIAIILAVAS